MKLEVTRLPFRHLDVDFSVQSTLSVFCVAGLSILFLILLILFTLEKNLSRLLVSALHICYIY